jgi:hypothetical protein
MKGGPIFLINTSSLKQKRETFSFFYGGEAVPMKKENVKTA